MIVCVFVYLLQFVGFLYFYSHLETMIVSFIVEYIQLFLPTFGPAPYNVTKAQFLCPYAATLVFIFTFS